MEKTIVFTDDFWYDEGTLISAGEYPFIEGGRHNFPMFFADDEWWTLYNLDTLEYEVL